MMTAGNHGPRLRVDPLDGVEPLNAINAEAVAHL
jgi:hypothetical protein